MNGQNKIESPKGSDHNQSSGETDRAPLGLNARGIIIAVVAILLWISLLMAGILVNSQPYREAITNFHFTSTESSTGTEASPSFMTAAVVVLLCYTPSNLIFLCMVAGLLGALSRIARLHAKGEEDEPDLPADKTNPFMSGVLRGLFVYLLAISGILLVNETPITAPDLTGYVRLAGLLSILSFLLSYNPGKFQSFIAKGMDTAQEKMGIGRK